MSLKTVIALTPQRLRQSTTAGNWLPATYISNSTSFPGSSLYFLEVERGPWERGCSQLRADDVMNGGK